MRKLLKVGDVVVVRGLRGVVRRLRPAGTIDVELETGSWVRVSGLWLQPEGEMVRG